MKPSVEEKKERGKLKTFNFIMVLLHFCENLPLDESENLEKQRLVKAEENRCEELKTFNNIMASLHFSGIAEL